jgi:hypothetical protein
MRGHRESWTDRRDPRTASNCEIIEMLNGGEALMARSRHIAVSSRMSALRGEADLA